MTRTRDYRIGIDVGGTFTDFVLADPVTGWMVNFKEPSTPADPSSAVETGLRALLAETGIEAGDISLVVHGTTIALNAVIPCFSEGVQQMKVGGKARLTCPPDTAYGDRGKPPMIGPAATLVFEVELVEIVATPQADAPAAP